MSVQQRFCPLCDRVFQEGEAVLRCEGCAVMHHPGCWVTNGGCATESEHRIAPAAMAYSALERPSGAQAPHPGEGTRLGAARGEGAPPLPEPIPFRPAPQHREAEPNAAPPAGDGPVIGGPQGLQPMIHRTLPSTVGVPTSAPRRYQPPPGDHMARRQMPKIYDRHPVLGYWYVPVAVALAIFVALSVIWVAGRFTGGGHADEASTPTPGPTSVAGGATTAPAASVSAAPTSSTTAVPSTGPGKFKGGDRVVVSGTAPDCLNVRVKAGTENAAIVCAQDGTELRVTGGPEVAGQFTWWKVQTELGEGWAAEDYLSVKP